MVKSRVRKSKPASAQEMPIEAEPVISLEKEAQETRSAPKPEQVPSTTSALLVRKKNLRK
jgi:hypothetical protein